MALRVRVQVVASAWVLLWCPPARSLDNGLGVVPPLGWSSWNALRGGITEQLIRAQAEAMVSSGMKAAGYQYINIDDMWAEMKRGTDGRLVPNREKFPNGIKNLSDHIHGLGLKFGLYTDVGRQTCGGQPGSYQHECLDAQQFADWGVDWVKEDHCSPVADQTGQIDGFYNAALAKMRDCLNATGRPIFFNLCAHSCYDAADGGKHSRACWSQWYTNATRLGNSWRTTTDIKNSWASVLNNWYRNDKFSNTLALAQFNGPSHFNDPDSLVVGMGQLSLDQERLHFSMWAIMAAPIIAGNRLDQMSPQTRDILTHRGLLAINQDPMGVQGSRIQRSGFRTNSTDVYGDPLSWWEQEVWAKPLLLYPGQLYQYGWAIALVNHGDVNATVTVDTNVISKRYPKFLPSDSAAKFDALELWTETPAGDVVLGDKVSWPVPPNGVAVITLDPDCGAVVG